MEDLNKLAAIPHNDNLLVEWGELFQKGKITREEYVQLIQNLNDRTSYLSLKTYEGVDGEGVLEN